MKDQMLETQELMATAPNLLIFMRRYEIIDFHWGFLAIFYKMDASTKI